MVPRAAAPRTLTLRQVPTDSQPFPAPSSSDPFPFPTDVPTEVGRFDLRCTLCADDGAVPYRARPD